MNRFGPLALLLLLAACSDTQGGAACREPSDCGAPAEAYRCDADSRACLCRTDAACAPGELCNPAGFCQPRAGCEKNADCTDPAFFCDTSTGTCLARGRCTTDLHCEAGEVCDASRAACEEGCRSAGDCPGTACRCGDAACVCDAVDEAGRAACAVGVCDAAFCASERDCAFGERCGTPAGESRARCYSDADPLRRPYCASCNYGGGIQVCGRGANYCLVETAPGGGSFCGVDCSGGQVCPNGYQCADVVVAYSRSRCRTDAECSPDPSLPCHEDGDCPHGGGCVKGLGEQVGACAGRCDVAEGDVLGYCSCLLDTDCAQGTCSQGSCTLSRKPCVTDGDCRPVRCVDLRGVGGCLIGQNCAPDEGLTCNEVVPR
ncbi:hypothetical protein [Hyalangium minutum]|uniref:Dickkopf N-terminal cysteine-rich domain-containing protein n=1 Tax=Hyalangium minutum TaxID=394096 RepID=A0A085W4C7_9BACT|nr:hypothetical protein [Hyalangium minutum]KFE62540.1 hypothetical protein DB31_3974 [Hyalangium minutum]